MLGLWITWLVSLIAMSLIVFVAMWRVPPEEFRNASGMSAGDIIRGEADAVRGAMLQLARATRPHADRIATRVVSFARNLSARAAERFNERVYGRGGVEEGRAASFFIKRIREFKDELSHEELQ